MLGLCYKAKCDVSGPHTLGETPGEHCISLFSYLLGSFLLCPGNVRIVCTASILYLCEQGLLSNKSTSVEYVTSEKQ